MVNKKIKLFLILSSLIFIFFTLYLGLNKNNYYTTENIVYKKIENFESYEFFSNKKISFKNISPDKKYIILNIWSSWCLPCRKEHKNLTKLRENIKADIIGLNYKDKFENAKSFLSELGNPYDIILKDKNGLISIEIGAYGVPETYLINNINKKIIKKYLGPINEENIKEIQTLVNQ